MSTVSYHARVDAERLAQLRSDPDAFWNLPESAGLGECGLLYLDKDWSVLGYLLSSKARDEHTYDAALHSVMRRRGKGDDLSDKNVWHAAMQAEAQKMGLTLVDTRSLPDDPLLVAIAGRGAEEDRIEGIGYGALVLEPQRVVDLSASLNSVGDHDIREFFDPERMELLDVGGIQWTEEDTSVLDEILIPCFGRLKTFFQRAADAQQYVLVAHQ